jgi:membrane protein DedA with SNARE-associated domain
MLDWITSFLRHTGVLGVAALMCAEHLFPPVPSELIMPLAGYTAAQGTYHLVWAVLFGSLGSLAGAVVWYAIGRGLGVERLKQWAGRHGRWLALSPADIDTADDWFCRHGHKAVLFGRLVPTVRTLISIPAGITRMPFGTFLLYSGIGTAIWTTILAGAGYLLKEEYEAVAHWLDPVSYAVLVGLLLGYAYRVATFKART